LQSPESLFGIVVKENYNLVKIYYIKTGHLGSILALYDATTVQQTYAQSFDAWGRERNPETWNYTLPTSTQKPEWLTRNYTGHSLSREAQNGKHLPEFGLINMRVPTNVSMSGNGRMYDPILGRMLSPDNFVQDPSSTQSYNRYSYCWNNPLKYTDPSGEIVWVPIVIGAVVGGYLGGAAASGEWNPVSADYWNDGWEGVIAGAIIGGLAGSGVGIAIAGKKAAGGLTLGQKATMSGISSGTLNTVNNASTNGDFGFSSLAYFGAGFAGGYMGASFGPLAGIMIGGIANTTAGIGTGNVTDGYSLAQHFVGGALSGYAGFSSNAMMAKPMTASYLKKNAHNIFAKYGTQATLSDFAYDGERKFFKKNVSQHFGTFYMGGLGGILQSYAMSSPLTLGIEQGLGRSAFFGLVQRHQEISTKSAV